MDAVAKMSAEPALRCRTEEKHVSVKLPPGEQGCLARLTPAGAPVRKGAQLYVRMPAQSPWRLFGSEYNAMIG